MLNNWTQAEAALQTATESAGSALLENERYLESIQGHLDRLATSWQELWNNAVESRVLKFFIDLGTQLVKTANALNPINTLFSILAGVIANRLAKFYISGGGFFGKLALSIKDARKELTNFQTALAMMNATQGNPIVNSEMFGVTGSGFGTRVNSSIANANLSGLKEIEKIMLAGEGNKLLGHSVEQLGAIRGISKELQGPLLKALKGAKTESEKLAVVQQFLSGQMKAAGAAAAIEAIKLAAIQIAVTAVTMAITTFIVKQIEAREEIKRLREEQQLQVQETAKSSAGLAKAAAAYEKAKSSYQSDPSKELEYRNAVQQVVTALGDKASALEGLVEDSDEYIHKVEQMTWAELRLAQAQQEAAIRSTRDAAREGLKRYGGTDFSTESPRLRNALTELSSFSKYEDSFGEVTITFRFNGDDVEEAKIGLNDLTLAMEILQEEADRTGKKIEDVDGYDEISNALAKIKENLNPVIEQEIRQYKTQQDLQGIIPKTAKEFEKYKENFYEQNAAAKENKEIYDDLLNQTYPGLAADLEELAELERLLGEEQKNLDPSYIPEKLRKAYEEYKTLTDKMQAKGISVLSIDDSLSEEDKEILSEYSAAFGRLKREADKAGVSIEDFISKLERQRNIDIAQKYREGTISIEELKRAAEDAGMSVGDFLDKFDAFNQDDKIDPAKIQEIINAFEGEAEKLSWIRKLLSDSTYEQKEFITSVESAEREIARYQRYLESLAEEIEQSVIGQINALEESIDGFQTTASNMASIIEQVFSGSMNANTFLDGIQAVSKAIAELKTAGASGAEGLISMMEKLPYGDLKQFGTIAEQVAKVQLKALLDLMERESGVVLSKALKDSLGQMIQLEAKTKGAVAGLSNLAGAYNTIMSAIDQYNEDGMMTINSLTTILSLEPQYLQMLEFENGQLKLNEQKLKEIAAARIADAKAALYANAEHQIAALLAQDQTNKNRDLQNALDDTKTKVDNVTTAMYNNAKGTTFASGEYLRYAAVLRDAGRRKSNGSISDGVLKEIDTIRKNTTEQAKIYDRLLSGITTGSKEARNKIMGYTNDAAKNAEDKAKEVADKIKSAIDDAISKWKRALDAGGLSWSQYLRNIEALAKKFKSQLSKEDYQEYELQVLEGRKEMYEKAASAVQNYLNRQKEGIQDQISVLDEQTKQIEDEIEKIEEKYGDLIKPLEKRSKELEKQKKILEKEIEAIEDGYEEMLKPLQKQLQALQDQADALQAIIDGINNYYDVIVTPLNRRLEELNHTKDNLEDALSDINAKYDALVKPYNKQIDNKNTQISALQRVIKEREREIEKIRERYETEIEANEKIIKSYQKIQKELQKNIKAYEAEIKAIEKRMKPYQDQQDAYNEQIHVLQDEQRRNNKAIRDLERLKDAQEQLTNPLQEQLDALKEANDERNKELELMRAKYNLERAMNQKTNLVYTGGQFEYQTDNKAIRDAQDALGKLMEESEIAALEDAIKKLQKPIDEIDKQIAEIQRKNTLIGYDISDIEDEIHWLDDALEPFQKEIDAVNEKIQEVQDRIDEWAEKIEVLTERNELLTEQMEAQLAPIEDVIKGLEKQVELLEEEVEKLEAIVAGYEDAREAESEYYNDTLEKINREIELLSRQVREWEYLRTQALRTHEDNLAGINREISALDNQIKAIERERDAFTESRKEEVEAIEKVISKIADEIEIFEELRDAEKEAFEPILKNLERQKEALQKQVDALEKYAKSWQQVIDKWERIKEEKLLEEMFGKNWKALLDSLDPTIVEDFSNKAIKAFRAFADQAARMAGDVGTAIDRVNRAAKEGASGGMSSFGDEVKKTSEKAKTFRHTAQELQEDLWKIGKTSNTEKENVKKFNDSIKDITKVSLKGELRNISDDIKKVGGASGDAAPKTQRLLDTMNRKLEDNSGIMRNMASGAGELDKKVTNNLVTRIKDFIGALGQKLSSGAQNVWNALNNSRNEYSQPQVVTGKLIKVTKYEKGGRVEIPTASVGRRITADDLFSDIARKLGEDTMVAAKVGEGIFTKRQTDDLEEFIQLTPSLIQSTKELQNIAKIFEASFERNEFVPSAIQNYVASAIQQADRTAQGLAASVVNNETNLNFTVGDITIQHAENASDLARQIKQNFPNAALQAFMST